MIIGLTTAIIIGLTSQQQLLVNSQETTAVPIPIISYNDEVNPDGSYVYGYEAGNGIKIEANGNGESQSGSVKYVDPDGNPVEWTYTADANGYQPQGPGIPAIPDYILRSLQYIRDHSTPSPATSQPVTVVQ